MFTSYTSTDLDCRTGNWVRSADVGQEGHALVDCNTVGL